MRLRTLLSHTIIYGLAAIFPRLLNLILTPLHTAAGSLSQQEYGLYQGIFAYIILGNVVLTYGMETAFFRFNNQQLNKQQVTSTAAYSLVFTTALFLVLGWIFLENIALWLQYPLIFISHTLLILAFDTLCVLPFAQLRNEGKALKYAIVRTAGVLVNLFLNLLFLLIVADNQEYNNLLPPIIRVESKTEYVLMANTLSSLFTLICLAGFYKKISFSFNFSLWKKLIHYGFPILIAGVSFSINESFDRIFIRHLSTLPDPDASVGVYAACYKMGVFMTLFITAYRLGLEPFFFKNSTEKNAPSTYAKVSYYFSLMGAYLLLFVCVFTDLLKWLLIPNELYWSALNIVPIVLLANLCLGIYHSLSVWYKVTDRTHYGAIISVIGCCVTLVGNFLLVPIMDYMGAAITTLLSYGGMMLLSFYIGQKKYPIPYDTKKIGIFLAGSALFSFVYFFFLDRNIFIGITFLTLYTLALLHSERILIKKWWQKNFPHWQN